MAQIRQPLRERRGLHREVRNDQVSCAAVCCRQSPKEKPDTLPGPLYPVCGALVTLHENG